VQSNWWIDTLMFAQWGLMVALIVLLVRRSLIAEWPSVFSYAVVALSSSVVQYFLRYPHPYLHFFCVFWITEGVLAIMQIWVVFDVLRATPGLTLIPRSWRITARIAIGAVAVGCGVLAMARQPDVYYAIKDWALLLSKATNIATQVVLCGIFVCFSAIGFGWMRRPFTVTAGIACHVVAGYIAASLLQSSNRAFHLLGQGVSNLATLACLAIWCYAMLRNEPELRLSPHAEELLLWFARSIKRSTSSRKQRGNGL
jgi:multisubunit Na+/H+ antiporter MnhG subunit